MHLLEDLYLLLYVGIENFIVLTCFDCARSLFTPKTYVCKKKSNCRNLLLYEGGKLYSKTRCVLLYYSSFTRVGRMFFQETQENMFNIFVLQAQYTIMKYAKCFKTTPRIPKEPT